MTSSTRTQLAVGLVAAVLLGAACGGGSDDASDSSADTGDTATTLAPEPDPAPTTEAPVDEPPADEPAEEPEVIDDPPPTTQAPPTTTPPLVPALDLVETVSTLADVGDQPTLEWGSVEGAADYRVVVRDGDGAAYWAWSGPETSVILGGGSSPDGAGARVPEGGEWSVIARDAELATIATSGWTPLTSS